MLKKVSLSHDAAKSVTKRRKSVLKDLNNIHKRLYKEINRRKI